MKKIILSIICLTLISCSGGDNKTEITVSIDLQCDINAGSGVNVISIEGTNICSVTGSSPVNDSGTTSFECISGDTITISATCSATTCRAFANSLSNLNCPFTAPNYFSGDFNGATGFSSSASVDCTCSQ